MTVLAVMLVCILHCKFFLLSSTTTLYAGMIPMTTTVSLILAIIFFMLTTVSLILAVYFFMHILHSLCCHYGQNTAGSCQHSPASLSSVLSFMRFTPSSPLTKTELYHLYKPEAHVINMYVQYRMNPPARSSSSIVI